MRDKEFFERRDYINEKVQSAFGRYRSEASLATNLLGDIVDAILLLAQVIQERPDSGAEHCLTPKKVS